MFKRKLPWLPVILWMMVIFYLSSQTANDSNNLSMGLTRRIYDVISVFIPSLEIDFFNHIIRKNAHFIAYFILGILSTNALYLNGIYNKRAFSIGLSISVIYAITDEIHQLFVPGRAGRMLDVLIDSSGALVGIILYILLFKLIDKKRRTQF